MFKTKYFQMYSVFSKKRSLKFFPTLGLVWSLKKIFTKKRQKKRLQCPNNFRFTRIYFKRGCKCPRLLRLCQYTVIILSRILTRHYNKLHWIKHTTGKIGESINTKPLNLRYGGLVISGVTDGGAGGRMSPLAAQMWAPF